MTYYMVFGQHLNVIIVLMYVILIDVDLYDDSLLCKCVMERCM